MFLHSKKNSFFYWLPRTLAIAYILFLSLFALDVFVEGASLWAMIGGFLIHLIPTYVLVLILWIAWRHEKIGGMLFILLATTFGIIFRNPLPTNLILLLPPFIIGLLFWFHDQYKKTNPFL